MRPTTKPIAATTAHLSRLRIFQSTRRPICLDQKFETSWGSVRVKGKLGQGHQDVLEAILLSGLNPSKTDSGATKLLVDPARVRAYSRQRSGTTLIAILDELMAAVVEIIEPKSLACRGTLINSVVPACRADGTRVTRPNPFGGDRCLWRVELGNVADRLIDHDLPTYRSAQTMQAIASLKHGITQSIVRLALSHRPNTNGFGLDKMICAVSGLEAGKALRDRRREIKQDADRCRQMGILITNGWVHVDHQRSRNEQKHGGVEQKHGGVEQKHGVPCKSMSS